MGKLLRDVSCSRLLEVAVAVAPPDVAEEFYTRFLKGRLLSLASHHCANFVVQSTLAAAQGKEQVGLLVVHESVVLNTCCCAHYVKTVRDNLKQTCHITMETGLLCYRQWEQLDTCLVCIDHAADIRAMSHQVRALFTELEPVLGELLKRNRSGVVAALVAACGRANVCQREVCAALARAVLALPQWQGDTGGWQPVEGA